MRSGFITGSSGALAQRSPMIRVRSLGTAIIEVGREQFTPASARSFAALLYLAAQRGHRVSRTTLQGLLFPDQTSRNASHSLRQLVYKLRQAGAPIEAT